MPEIRKYTVVDLFAGVGGLSYGFSRNDRFEIILANEMQKDIAKAYTINHPSVNMLQGDIKNLSEDILRQAIGNRTVDVVVGGPPCQSYSTLGKRHCPSSSRCIHPRDSRALTIREGARLQSFPDNYQFYGSDCLKRLEIGNAVPPLLSEALAEQMLKALDTEK